MHTPDDATLDALYAALDCDPETGDLVWLDPPSRRVAIGSLAGTLNRAGRVVVGFAGRQYQGAHLAWFFYHDGQWPTQQVRFRNGNPSDLTRDNLISGPAAYSDTPKAAQMRRYRQRLKERKAPPPEEKSSLETVTFSYNGYDYDPKVKKQVRGKVWCARAVHDLKIVLATFQTRQEAEAYAIAAANGYAFVQAHPVPTDLANPGAKAGKPDPAILTLQEAHGLFAYDETSGAFYRRWPDIWVGTPAEYFNDRKRPFLRARGRQYTAGMMAWFLKTGQWPGRKQIAYRDKNPRNTAFTNLYLKDAEA